jgi:hypothetical protein
LFQGGRGERPIEKGFEQGSDAGGVHEKLERL